ncbi:unnamed protein product [Caenorhabditis angaria]|uniref:Cystinosin homolog n=1 Tax=Caenorhabditis angaria TaxID=860376 RepID=A0A9P1IDG2_9PELO|nr:unnamed protein product [Caenorhabditis angaria]
MLVYLLFLIKCSIFIIQPVVSLNDLALLNENDRSLEIVIGQKIDVEFVVKNHSSVALNDTILFLSNSLALSYDNEIELKNWTAKLEITGVRATASSIVEIVNCSTISEETCPLNLKEAYVRVSVIRSNFMAILIQIVGWSYFFAWSISFYPQIWLNFKRKSVIGLNFDFLALNLLGFGAYAIYNLLMYFNEHVKQIYNIENPHSPPPVLSNDVVFAVHAFFACAVTVVQCFIYERENQKVSIQCIVLSIGLITFGFFSAAATVLNKISILSFVTSLSYIKMAVTCSKYFPQAYYNFVRKSTVGWSIGNILLDFTGGSLDILQMVFQALNVDDWSAFYANPVKFGLGLVSIVFDIVFIIQHYVLYKDAEESLVDYEDIDENPDDYDNSDVAPIIGEA